MKKLRRNIGLKRQWASTNDWPLAALRPLSFFSDTRELDVHTVHVFDEETGSVVVVFVTPVGSVTVRMPRSLAGQVGNGLLRLIGTGSNRVQEPMPINFRTRL